MDLLDDLLHKIGFGSPEDEVTRVKLGPGVVGNTTTAVIVASLAAFGAAWALHENPAFALGALGIIAIVVLVYLAGTWKFANKNPGQSVLGGSEYLAYTQLMAAKGVPQVPL